ncbi:MAG: response regulator [Methylococcaceae bacterium]|nr:response regulator [Methylococcaceae bacterium]
MVGLIGFEVADEERLNRFFRIPRPGKRQYIAARSSDRARSDILLVNYDHPPALQEKDSILASYPWLQVVAASRGPVQEPAAYHIHGIPIAAEVLSVLDKVPVEPSTKSVSALSQVLCETNRPRLMDAGPVEVQARVTQQPGSVATSPTNGSYRVLVVDDSPAIQKSLELHLGTLPGIGVIDIADSGEKAIEKALAKQYDLIFLDVMMPGIDGYETCTRLRKTMDYKKTPIIMVSGKTSPLDEVKGVVAGCTTYLTKPVRAEAFQKLGSRVLTWLEKQKRA